MEKLEEKSRTRSKKENIQQAVLATVAITGMLALAAVAPNTFQALELFGLNPKLKSHYVYRTKVARQRLIEKGLLKYVQGTKYIQLTDKGKKQLRLWGLAGYEIKKPKRWDKKWRILSFDIKEKKREVRDKLRLTLSKMGFYPIQRSVWVYPYDCEEFVQMLKADFRIGWEILYIIADQIENEQKLIEYFELK